MLTLWLCSSVCVNADAGHLCFSVEAAGRKLRGPDGHVIPVDEATLISADVLYSCCLRKDLGLAVPSLAKSLAGVHACITSIVMGEGNRWALVTCACREVKDW
jgi:hypothetical protein